MKRTSFLRLLCLMILPVFIWLGLLSCADFETETVTVGGVQTDGTVTFSADDDTVFAASPHSIMIVGKREIQIYNDKGSRKYYNQTHLNEPEVLANGSYFLVYDKNGSSCFLFRNEKLLTELQPEYPVYAAALDGGGSFALITKTYSSASAVQIYNANGHLENTVERSDYVIDCRFAAGGKLVLLTLDVQDGEWITGITTYKSDFSRIIYEKTFRNVYPLQLSANGNRVAVLCSDGVRVLDKKGKTRLISIGNVLDDDVVLQSNGRIVLLDDETVITCDAKGNTAEYISPLSAAENAWLCGDYLFLTQGRTIVRMNLKNGSLITGTASCDFNGIVLKDSAGQVYLTLTSSLVLYNVE